MFVRVLVTGGAGFIGGTIVNAALAAGYEVSVLDSLREDVHAPGSIPRDDVAFVRGDITDPQAVREALAGVDVVCHQAAKVGLGVNFADTPDYVRSNDLGTAVLLAEMNAVGVKRLVVASSMVVYGEGAYTLDGVLKTVPPRREEDLARGVFDPVDAETGRLLRSALVGEEAPFDPRNVYAATKVQQEYLAKIWAQQTGGIAALLRYHNVYGPGMPQNTPYAGVASLFRSRLARGEAPLVFEDGGQRRDFVHVRDVAAANLAAFAWVGRQQSGISRAFNVGSGQIHTIGDMARLLAEYAAGPAPVVTGEYRLGDVRHITADSTRLRRELQVPEPVMFDAGMREFATAPLREAVR